MFGEFVSAHEKLLNHPKIVKHLVVRNNNTKPLYSILKRDYTRGRHMIGNCTCVCESHWFFQCFWRQFWMLDVSSWLCIQFLTRNPIFRSPIPNSDVQGPNIGLENLDFLSYNFLLHASTVLWSQLVTTDSETKYGGHSSYKPPGAFYTTSETTRNP